MSTLLWQPPHPGPSCPCSALATTVARTRGWTLQPGSSHSSDVPAGGGSPSAKMRWEHSETERGETDEFRVPWEPGQDSAGAVGRVVQICSKLLHL